MSLRRFLGKQHEALEKIAGERVPVPEWGFEGTEKYQTGKYSGVGIVTADMGH